MPRNPHKLNIPRKDVVWPFVENGELVLAPGDIEASGFSANDAPYTTRGSPYPTEVSFHLQMLGGTYLGDFQTFMDVPEWALLQPSARILQRAGSKHIPDFNSEERYNFHAGMARVGEFLEEGAAQALLNPELGLPRDTIKYEYYNKAFKPKNDQTTEDYSKPFSEEVIYFPTINDDGEVCYDVRIHVDTLRVARRVDTNPDSKYYWNTDNLFMRDPDGSIWVDQPLRMSPWFFNRGYDIPILQTAFLRSGWRSRDTTVFSSQAKISDKLSPKRFLGDGRDLMYWNHVLGRKAEDSLVLGEILDPRTLKIRHSEKLTEILKAAMDYENPIRLLQGGIFLSDTGEKPDLALAHGALQDSRFLGAMITKSMEQNPGLFSEYARRRDQKRTLHFLTQVEPKGKTLPLFLLPRREAGRSHTATPYYFLGDSSQFGDDKKMLFLRCDGKLREACHSNGKLLKDLNQEEMFEFFEEDQKKAQADRVFRTVGFSQSPAPMAFDSIKGSAAVETYKKSFRDIQADYLYLSSNQDMTDLLLNAFERRQQDQLNEGYFPLNPRYEDYLLAQYSGDVKWQMAALERERQAYQINGVNGAGPGPRVIPSPLHTIHAGMNNFYQYLLKIDSAFGDLCLKSFGVDEYAKYWTRGNDGVMRLELPEMSESEHQIMIQRIDKFKRVAEAAYTKLKAEKHPYADFLKRLLKKENDKSSRYFQKGAKKKTDPASSKETQTIDFQGDLEDILRFRFKILGKMVLHDYEYELTSAHSSYIEGDIDKSTMEMTRIDSSPDILPDKERENELERPLLLFFDPDNGNAGNGNIPVVVNKTGQELDIDYIASMDFSIVKDKLGKNQRGDKWSYRFRRIPADPSIMILAQRYVDYGLADQIPPNIFKMYVRDRIERLRGMLNETVDTDRAATIRGCAREIQKLIANATHKQRDVVDRDPNPMLGKAADVLEFEESGVSLVRYSHELRALDTEISKLEKAYPPEIGGINPENNLPFDYIPHLINRTAGTDIDADPNLIVADIPIWHMRSPIEQYDRKYHHRSLIIPNTLSDKQKKAIRGTAATMTLVGREPETGVVNVFGPVRPRKAPDLTSPKYEHIAEPFRQAMEAAGQEFDPNGDYLLVEIEDIYPVANTRAFERDVVNLNLPTRQFWGMTTPEYVGLGSDRVTAHIVPADYFAQKIKLPKKGEKILRLREMAAEPFANLKAEQAPLTGHVYDAEIDKVWGLDQSGIMQGYTLDELIDKIQAEEHPDLVVKSMGFKGMEDVKSVLLRQPLSQFRQRPTEEKFGVIFTSSSPQELRSKWAWISDIDRPRAAFTENGAFVPHSAYQPFVMP